MNDKIRIYKNKITEEVFLDRTKTETILTKYTEDDYIFIATLIYYLNKKKDMKINISNHDQKDNMNGLLAFSYKTQTWIKTKRNEKLNSYFKEEIKPVDDASDNGYIDITDFTKTSSPSISSNQNYEDLINKITEEKLKKLKEFRQAIGYLPDNFLSMTNISKIDINSGIIEKIFNDISKQFLIDNPLIYFRSNEYYEMWRNKLIKLTVDNIKRKRINKDFLSFILLHIFKLAYEYGKIDIIDLVEIIPDGRKKKKRKSKRKLKKSKRKSRN